MGNDAIVGDDIIERVGRSTLRESPGTPMRTRLKPPIKVRHVVHYNKTLGNACGGGSQP